MAGVVYIACTPVGRHIIRSHLKHHPSIPVAGIVNLDRTEAMSKANYDSLFDVARDNAIELLYCGNVNSPEVLAFIREKDPVLVIQSGWSQKFGKELLAIPKNGCIGEHPAPIPIGRGAACVNWAIIEDRKEWGDSFFKMVDKFDAGPVFAQRKFRIEDYDNVFTVFEKVAMSSCEMIRDNLHHWYNGVFNPLTLDETTATYYKRRRPKDGELNFSWDDRTIYNYVRALTKPYPGAFFSYKGSAVTVWDAELLNETTAEPACRFAIDTGRRRLLVSTGNNKLIALGRLQIAGLPEVFGHEFFDAAKTAGID